MSPSQSIGPAVCIGVLLASIVGCPTATSDSTEHNPATVLLIRSYGDDQFAPTTSTSGESPESSSPKAGGTQSSPEETIEPDENDSTDPDESPEPELDPNVLDDPTDPNSDVGESAGGSGVFVNISNAGGIIRSAFDIIRADDVVDGVQVRLTWAELEPQKGEYNWNVVDTVLSQYASIDRRVALALLTASGRVPYDGQPGDPNEGDAFENDATPAWLFDDSDVWRVGDISTPKGQLPLYPVFWDPAYQAHLAEFVAAFADRYDGDDRIEFIRMGGWQIGTTEPTFYTGATEYLIDQLADHGMHVTLGQNNVPTLSPDDPYAAAIDALVDLWSAYFEHTRLSATIHFAWESGGFEEQMNTRCAERGILLLNNGLNEGDKQPARERLRRWYEDYGCQVGWGGITQLGTKLTQQEQDALPHDLRMEMFMQGIGVAGDPRYAPPSQVSYIVVGLQTLQYRDAVEWAAAHLEP